MQIEIKIDETCKESRIIIVTNEMSNEINAIIKKLSAEELMMIAGFKDDTVELLEANAIYRIFSSGGKVLAETDRGVFTIRLRLYEVEERLDSYNFLRISNSELINLKKVKSFDLSFAGTICVALSNGTVTYASRRYVSKIKQKLDCEVDSMKKQIVLRALLGFPLGISIGFIISILISLRFGNGSYSPCVSELAVKMRSEINAVIFQTVLSGILGSVFAASSVIWEIESWSIAKQTGIYFAITAVAMMPIAYYANWMEHSLFGFLGYFGIFVLIFAFVWIVQYLIWKKKIEKMNRSIKEIRENH